MKKSYLFLTSILFISLFSFGQTDFTVSQTQSCDDLDLNITNNHPSSGYTTQPFVTTGFTYHWNFGNNQTSTLENPASIHYSNPGTYQINYSCSIDTVGFFLTGILVTQVSCTDPFGGSVDPYIIIRDNSQNVVFSTESSHINDQDPPYSWGMNLKLDNPPYFIWIWDYDSMDANDNCVDDTENEPGTATVLTLPANNSSTFGSTIANYTNGGLIFQAYFNKPVTTYNDSVIITVHANPNPPTVVPPIASYCIGETIPDITATGTGNNIIKWYTDSALTQLLNVGSTYTVNQNLAGTYNFYVTQTDNITGCTSDYNSAQIIISKLPAPVLSSYNGNFCTGETLPYIIATGQNIKWYSDSLLTHLISQNDTLQIMDTIPGTYQFYVTQTDTERNCVSSPAIYAMTFIQGIDANFTITNVTCHNGSDGSILTNITAGSSPFILSWSNGNTQSNISNLSSGEYLLTVIDANHCLRLFSEEIQEPQAISDNPTIVNINCYNQNTGAIELNVSGGTAPYTYIWSNQAATSSISSLSAGNYYVTISDAHYCTYTNQYTLTQPDSIHFQSLITPESCNGKNDGKIQVTVSGGIQPYQYQWNTGSSQTLLENLHMGSYIITVTDANLCNTTKNITLMSTYEFCLDIPNVFTPNGDGVNDKWEIRFINMYPDCNVKVFNRWGQILYESTGYTTEWDGKWNGKEIPSGSYYYSIDLKTGDEKNIFTGTIDIVR